MKLISKFTN